MSMVNNLREFVDKKLMGIVKWGEHTHLLNDGSRDFAAIEINPPLRQNGINFHAFRFRLSCRSSYQEPPLGNIEFIDLEKADYMIVGPILDETWTKIATRIKQTMGYEAVIEIPQSPLPPIPPPPEESPDGFIPLLCTPVIYFTNPGESVAGMSGLAALVTRVHSELIVDLIVFPPSSEPFHRENVPRKSGTNRACRWDFAESVLARLTEQDRAAAAE